MSTRKNINKIKNRILRNTRKKRKSLKKVSIETEIIKIQTEITKLRFEIKDIDKKIYSRKINKAFKRQLKNKQGILLRKIKKLKAKLENQKYKRQFILASGRMTSQEEKKACTQNLKGEIKNDKCYMQTPFKTDCRPEERIIKNNPNNIRTITGNQFDRQVGLHENKVVYCPVDRILDQYGDEFEFVEFELNETK